MGAKFDSPVRTVGLPLPSTLGPVVLTPELRLAGIRVILMTSGALTTPVRAMNSHLGKKGIGAA